MKYNEWIDKREIGTVYLIHGISEFMFDSDLSWCMVKIEYTGEELLVTRCGITDACINNMHSYTFGNCEVYETEENMKTAVCKIADEYMQKLCELKKICN